MLKKLVDLLEVFEGFKEQVYLCSAGKKTIGIGTLWFEGMPTKVTHAEAVKLCEKDCVKFIAAVDKVVKVPLNENQKIALVSFVYNLGPAALASSTLLKKLNKGGYKEAAEEFVKWNKARVNGGALVEVKGLTTRRKAEKELFLESTKGN